MKIEGVMSTSERNLRTLYNVLPLYTCSIKNFLEFMELVVQTSESVREVVRSFLCLAALIAALAPLAFVARGTNMNEMKKGGMPADFEKLCTLEMRGSARTANMITPSNNDDIDLTQIHDAFSASPFPLSSSTNLSVSSQVLLHNQVPISDMKRSTAVFDIA